MPKIESWGNFPPGVRHHLIGRMRDREISMPGLNQLRVWVDSNPEVPEGEDGADARDALLKALAI